MRTPFLLPFLALALLAPACSDRDPNTPIALISVAGGQGGRNVAITFTLRSPDTVFVTIQAAYSTDGGNVYQLATASLGGPPIRNLPASPGGTQLVYLWDALADLGPGRHIVRFQIAPSAGGNLGTLADTGSFVLDNTDIFVRSADLAVARQSEAAAGLPDGGVIVAGGGGLTGVTEGYEPASDTITTRDALTVVRENARGVTVAGSDGAFLEAQPLVIAGTGAAGPIGSVERYDPGLDLWVLAAADVGARTGHTATPLLDGRVLVAGGGPGTDAVIAAGAASATPIAAGADRTGHGAVRLPDGRVLISGGTRAGSALGDTLIFDPTTNLYTPGPALQTARTAHATALAAGRVLVAGGRDAAGATLASAELADAGLTAFAALANALVFARAEHTATGLADGNVLIAGGEDATGKSLASAEKFSGTTLTFTRTRASLEVARKGHQATVFGGGRVLITGGGTSAIEVYYPQSLVGPQTFDPIAAPAAGRAEHEVTALPSGRALITGGTSGIVAGGQLVALASAELFDPALVAPGKRIAPAGATMTAARRRHTATALSDGSVLIAGGIGAGGTPLATLEIATFGTTTTTTTFTAAVETLPFALFDHTATRLADGKVLIAGGVAAGAPTASAFIFDPAASSGARLSATGPMATPRARHTATLEPGTGGRVLAAGGVSTGGAATASAERYDPTAATWTATTGDLGPARFGHAATALDDGRILIAGGRGGTDGAPATPTADARIFDPATGAIAAAAAMSAPRAELVAISIPGGRALLAGGYFDAAATSLTASVEAFSPATGPALAADPDLTRARRQIEAAKLTDGSTLLIGGRAEADVTVGGGERLSP